MARYVLSVDPGDVTGIGLFKDEELVLTASIFTRDSSGADDLLRFIRSTAPAVVVVEQPPQHGHSQWLTHLFALIVSTVQEMGAELSTIGPGLWKPTMKRHKMEITLTVVHQKDAVQMGMYYLRFRQIRRIDDARENDISGQDSTLSQ